MPAAAPVLVRSQQPARANRPTHAAPIDFARLVRRTRSFRRARAVALTLSVLAISLLAAYAVTGLAVLLPAACLAASATFASTYVASRLASAPLPRVR